MTRKRGRTVLKDTDNDSIYKLIPFLDSTTGLSRDLNVNGSVTPVSFCCKPTKDTYFYPVSIRYVVTKSIAGKIKFEDLDYDKFFQTTLVNGITIGSKISGLTSNFFIIKTMEDLFGIPNTFPVQTFIGPTKIKTFCFDLKLEGVFSLIQDRNDCVCMTIMDDLSGFTTLRAIASGYEISVT